MPDRPPKNSTLCDMNSKPSETCVYSILNRKILMPLLCCTIIAGCALIKLQEEVRESLVSTILVGRITTQFPGKGPIIVAAYSKNADQISVAHYSVLHDFGEYELMVAQGDYYVFAFWDKNQNLIYDAGEPAGQYGAPELISAWAGGTVPAIDFLIPEEATPIAIPYGFEIPHDKPIKLHSRLAGAIKPLDDDYFSEEYGAKGYWEASSFFKEVGGNIYFLEPYDPEKIPILFIHGATDTPRNWKFFIDNIDKERFQPWFFYYPSGARIDSMAYLLLWKLLNLQIKYKFDTLVMTAHSLGGLVSRSFLNDYGQMFPQIKLFVALATPWGGAEMAKYGVQQSPAVIPSWMDLQPDSPFIQSLYAKKLPDTVDFYIFYGYRGSRNPFRANNDNTIRLSSLLDWRSQSEAKMVYAFDEDHAGIMNSPEALLQYNTILNQIGKTKQQSPEQAGGYLKVDFAYDYPSGKAKHWPILALDSIENQHPGARIYLSPSDNGKVVGPFPVGNYRATLYSDGAKPDKTKVAISIDSQTTKTLDFVFTPDGIVAGNVASVINPSDHSVGMPPDHYLPAEQKIKIESIRLQGNGIFRSVEPSAEKNTGLIEPLFSRSDFCFNGSFQFFGLPAGTYDVVIKAEGYAAVSEKFYVNPGEEIDYKVIKLTQPLGLSP